MSYHNVTLQHMIVNYARDHYKFTYKAVCEYVHGEEEKLQFKYSDKEIREVFDYLVSIECIRQEKGNKKVHQMYTYYKRRG